MRRSVALASMASTASTVAAALVACSSGGGPDPASSGEGSSSAPAGGAGSTVVVRNFAFGPRTLTVAAGTKVTWRFADEADHNVDITQPKVQSPNRHAGQTFGYTFTTPGTYDYVCSIHQYMTGRIVVK